MLPFYKLLLSVGFIVLICFLFVLAVSQSLVASQKVFQDVHNCPDNWMYDNSDNQIRCFVPLTGSTVIDKSKNGGKLSLDTNNNISDVYNRKTPGTSTVPLNGTETPYINFYDKKWFDQSIDMPSRVCYLQQWANANEISWAGVSNNYNC